MIEQHLGEGCLTERPVTRKSLGRFRLCGKNGMSFLGKAPKDRSIQIELGSVLSVVVLFVTVSFYKIFRYFPA